MKDPLGTFLAAIFGCFVGLVGIYLLYIFFAVILFGAGTSCPQNLC